MRVITILSCFLLNYYATAQFGKIQGYVLNSTDNEAIPFANVQIQGTEIGTMTNELGYFELNNLQSTIYNIKIWALGYNEMILSEIQVTNNKPVKLNIQLTESILNLQEILIQSNAFQKSEESPLSLRIISVTKINRNPGSNRDISKVVQSLPGVTSTAAFRNDLIIRGGAPNENRFYLDDVEVPNINHFATQGSSGGPVGMINVAFIREVEFLSSAFPANRGNALSSVFDFKQRDGRDDRIGFSGTLGASDIGLSLEGPIGKRTTYLISARRSYLQFLFKVLELPFLPIYNDFQIKIKHKFNKKNEITFIGLGAYDDFELNEEANQTESQQYILNYLPISKQWNYTNGIVYKHYKKNGYYTFVLSRNMLNNHAQKFQNNDESKLENKILDYTSQEIENKLRIEKTQRYGTHKITYGFTAEQIKYNNQTYNRIYSSQQVVELNYNSKIVFYKYGIFGQYSKKSLNEKLTSSFGLRFDGNSYSKEMSNPFTQISPRVSFSYQIKKNIDLNANTGIYYQLPPYTILGYKDNNAIFVNRQNGIKYIRAHHYVLGLAYRPSSKSQLTVEGFLKQYHNYPILLKDSITLANLGGDFGIIGNEPASPFAKGKSYGLELMYQQKLIKGFYGIISLTFAKSQFEDKNHSYIPSAWDSRSIFNMTAGRRFKRNWEIGINWRFQSGLPYTPNLTESNLKLAWDINGKALLDYNQINSLRNQAINQIDFRVDKKWFFKQWNLNLYLDVENVTGSSIPSKTLILDRPLDNNNQPVGGPIIENPNAPLSEQRYKVKEIKDNVGVRLPSIGITIEF